MTTQFHTSRKLNPQDISVLVSQQSKNEIGWYISEIIANQLDPIKDVLVYCKRNLEESNDTQYKLPLSSHQSEVVKGTLTRENFKIIELHMVIHSPHFNSGKKFEFVMKSQEYIIIRQLLDCHDAIENAIHYMNKIMENEENEHTTELFMRYIDQICNQLKFARESLAHPQPVYEFPQLRNPGTIFEPVFPKTGALDFIINEGELSVEFKSLKIVEKRPWNVIIDQKNRLSFADVVRKQISKMRDMPMNRIISDEYMKYIEWRKQHTNEGNHEENGISGTIKNMFSFNGDPSLSTLIKHANAYLETSITYIDDDNVPFVVQVADRCQVVTSDPILLSISVKLESIDKTMTRISKNLSSISQI